MFESITFFGQNRMQADAPLDIGSLVECMLFYNKTIVVANQSILRQLFLYFGIDRLLDLISDGLIQIIFTETNVGIFTNILNGIEHHDAIMFSSPQHSYQDEIRKICIEVTGKVGKGRRSAVRVQDLITLKNHDDSILESSRKSILNQEYIDSSVRIILKSLIPEEIDFNSCRFNTVLDSNSIVIDTNINFIELNRIYHKYVSPSHSSISPALLLSHALGVESEIYFLLNNASEVVTSELSADLMSHKVNYLLEKSNKSSHSISSFQNLVLNDAKALRDAVNGRKIDLDELIKVLKHSTKFKKWTSGVSPNQDLIKSYYHDVTRKTLIDKLPSKSLRWGIFNSAGLIADGLLAGASGALVGLGLSILDGFFLDKLFAGWKPNQFIEKEVKGLLTDNDK